MTSVLGAVRRAVRLGPHDVSRRLVKRLSERFDIESLRFPLLDGDVADSTRRTWESLPARAAVDGPPMIGWVCTPPRPGSGGHTTLFRMVAGLEERGYRCVLFLYDRYDGDFEAQSAVIRRHWPELHAEIRDARSGVSGVDAAVASSWEMAHVLASRATEKIPMLYFVQDYEPYFYPRGSLFALAEDSYRFGFDIIALGEMVAGELRRIGVDAVTAPFGCDTEVYRRTGERERRGVVFYAKPDADRRGFLLARSALELFAARHPEQPIHVYGTSDINWPFPVVNHERLTPAELNALYNQALAGIAMSFTNISLVAEEILAAGAIPVINDSPLARADLPSAEAEWAPATAHGIADALCRIVENPEWSARSVRASASVRHGWGEAQDIVAEQVAAVLAPRSLPAAPPSA